ncbi:MAG TPA: protein-glutamate O-methyltransferase CheR [Fibrobacteraceae bacterium]|nr:protein-glutamate O-methyltransferase CheR [Fibrobacteraceae bacterium]
MSDVRVIDPLAPDAMDAKTYESFRRIIHQKAGIALGNGKQALMNARLAKRLRALHLPNYQSYLDYLLKDDSQEEIVQLLDVISTNTTSFFREAEHFSRLGEILQGWYKKGNRRFRIWCAAASTGEEPYTLSMVCQEALGPQVDLRILSTDISTRVLRQCRQGEYPREKCEGIPTPWLHKYFRQGKSGTLSANTLLRSPLTFARLNLMDTPYPMRGPFDVIFCRNVMIYFDQDGRRTFVEQAHRLLSPGGYLFTGHAESLTGIALGFSPVQPSVYRKTA